LPFRGCSLPRSKPFGRLERQTVPPSHSSFLGSLSLLLASFGLDVSVGQHHGHRVDPRRPTRMPRRSNSPRFSRIASARTPCDHVENRAGPNPSPGPIRSLRHLIACVDVGRATRARGDNASSEIALRRPTVGHRRPWASLGLFGVIPRAFRGTGAVQCATHPPRACGDSRSRVLRIWFRKE